MRGCFLIHQWNKIISLWDETELVVIIILCYSEESSSDGECDGETARNSRACQLHHAGKGSLRHRFLEGLLIPALLAEIPFSTASGSIKRSTDFRYECDLHPHTPSTSLNSLVALATLPYIDRY